MKSCKTRNDYFLKYIFSFSGVFSIILPIKKEINKKKFSGLTIYPIAINFNFYLKINFSIIIFSNIEEKHHSN